MSALRKVIPQGSSLKKITMFSSKTEDSKEENNMSYRNNNEQINH